MRVVEFEKNTQGVAYRWLNGAAIGTAFLTGIILILMVWNFAATRRADPIHTPALLKMTEDLKANPQNAAMKEQIRDLDLLARHAFFSSQRFQAISVFLLLGSAAAMVIAFRSLQTYKIRMPYPTGVAPKEDLAANAKWARNAIAVVGLVLIGIALSFAIPWKSPLDRPIAAVKVETKVALSTREDFGNNWPGFLGWTRGHATTSDLPVAWDSTNGMQWKTTIPLPGVNSPIAWGNRILLTGADAKRREIYCFDRETGALNWTLAVPATSEAPTVSDDTGLAAPTMATDGVRAFAIFGTGDLVAVNLEGKQVWAKNLGAPENSYGHGSSLVFADGLLFVQFDQQKNGSLLAIDAATGETKWKKARAFKASWATPLITEIGGKSELILAAAPAVVSYDPKTGAELWRVECLDRTEAAISPTLADGLLYVGGEGGGLVAVDVAKRTVAWREESDAPNVCTPLIVGDLLFHSLESGGIFCRNAKTGAKIWEAETDDGFYASPILSGDRVYMLDRAGTTHIFSATNKFNLIARAKLNEQSAGTPAAQGKSLFIRGTKHLFRVGS